MTAPSRVPFPSPRTLRLIWEQRLRTGRHPITALAFLSDETARQWLAALDREPANLSVALLRTRLRRMLTIHCP